MKKFEEPKVEMVRFSGSIISTSECGCFDADFCPSNYGDCTADGAGCECEINHNPALGNCTPCGSYNG